jgi:UDP-glucuronate 4-epimerase
LRRILITGAAGFIGSHLAERLLEEGGFEVTALDLFDDFYDPARKRANVAPALARAAAGAPYALVTGDIRDEALLERVFARGRLDQVVHLAARAGVNPSIERPLLYESVNVGGTIALLEAMRRHGVPEIVFASSSSVYGEQPKTPFSETDPVDRPISPYAATKRACEVALATWRHLYGIHVAALRFFTVYGPRQRPDLAIARFAAEIEAGRPITIFGDGTASRDFTYIDDTVQGVRAAMDRCRGYEIYNLGESATITVMDLVRLLEDALGRRAAIERRPARPGDVPVTFADITKARERLGYRPATPIAEGVRKYVAWLRSGRA